MRRSGPHTDCEPPGVRHHSIDDGGGGSYEDGDSTCDDSVIGVAIV